MSDALQPCPRKRALFPYPHPKVSAHFEQYSFKLLNGYRSLGKSRNVGYTLASGKRWPGMLAS
ncbi:hypothetical protein PCAR4_300024 [Paraburkholderia caribensis]|nr:hypothetical protein PCAR4_300024 [Paraburkholderia caribensis]